MADVFRYLQFRLDEARRTVLFDYQIIRGDQTHELTESLTFPRPLKDSDAQHASLRALHLALGISYYKIFVPGTIEHPYAMDANEAAYWNDIWHHGLGEFLYVNQLSSVKLAAFSKQDGRVFRASTVEDATGALLGIGGGKDSIVAGELLKSLGISLTGFVMATGEQLGQARAVADTMGVELLAVNRVLDKQLLELQEHPGGFKGHIPISLIFGLVGTALAIATSKQYVVVANEASASIPRVSWEGTDVNHQWSKSFGFEQQLQSFVQTAISPTVTYCSAIRQLTSVGVAKTFATFSQYFEVFTSDNYVFRIDPAKRPNARWSLESPKSLSSFILLTPWISTDDTLRIFGRNFLDEQSLEALFLRLTGLEGEPPLDCVGTVEELILSLNLAVRQGKFNDSFLMTVARDRGIISEDAAAALAAELELKPEQVLPEELKLRVEDKLQEWLKA